MKWNIVIWVLYFGSFTIRSQNLLPIQHDSTYLVGSYRQEIIISGVGEYLSNSVQNELVHKMIFGGAITEPLKDRSFLGLAPINRLGFDVSGEMEYRNYNVNLFKRSNFGVLLKSAYVNYGSVIFGKDLFGLAFYGNDRYLDQTANLSGTRLLGMSFQKFGIGLFDKIRKNAVSINLYGVSNYVDGNIYDGQLYQSKDADSISLTMDGRFDFSSGAGFLKGWGAGVDLDFRLPVQISERKTITVRFEAKNLGFCVLNKSLERYQMDTSIHFKGYSVDQLVDVQNGQFTLSDTLGIEKSIITKWRLMPAILQIGKIVSNNDSLKVQSFYGIRMYGLSAYTPMLFAGLHYQLASFFDLGLSTMVGGFGGLRFGLYTNWKIGGLIFSAGTENLIGLTQKTAKGQSLTIRLRCAI